MFILPSLTGVGREKGGDHESWRKRLCLSSVLKADQFNSSGKGGISEEGRESHSRKRKVATKGLELLAC